MRFFRPVSAPPCPAPRRRARAPARLVLWLIVATCLPELLLDAADWGLIGSVRWRPLAYQYGAFWAGLLHDWQPNYVAQPATMFLSYAFLHGGLMHLASNMIALLVLGPPIVERAGPRGFLALYVLSAIGGGVGFGLLATSAQPMVGASGALFGLVGAWQYWEWRRRRLTGAPMWPLWRALLGFALLNFVMWLALSGLLAWETHLGGFVAGWGAAALLRRLSRPDGPSGRA